MNTLLLQDLRKVSPEAVDLLIRFPRLRNEVFQALEQPPFPFDYQPSVIEVFDQQGLLAGRIFDHVYTTTVPSLHSSKFLAWYLDGELAFFSVGSDVVLNRLTSLSVAALFELPKKERNS